MKRDLDLVRQLLLVIESASTQTIFNPYGLNDSDPRVQYHLRLLVDAGLVRPVGHTTDGAISVRLTWNGHEFLEIARNESVWARAKKFVRERTTGLSVEVLRTILTRWTFNTVEEEEQWRIEDRQPVNGAAKASAEHVIPVPHFRRRRLWGLNGSDLLNTAPADKTPHTHDPYFQYYVVNGNERPAAVPYYML